MKKFLVYIISLIFCLTSFNIVASADAFDGYVYFICERTTLGQGLAVEPIKVGFYKTETLASIVERALGDKSTHTGALTDYYLSGVKDGGTPSAWSTKNIPIDIANALKDNDDELGSRFKKDTLSEFDYTSYSGWMFFVDNNSISMGANSIKYSATKSTTGSSYTDNSVIRLMFTVYGYGEDIGAGFGYYTFNTTNTFASRDDLIRLVADKKAYSTSKPYINAINLLSTWNVSKSDLSDAYDALRYTYSIDYSNTVTATFDAAYNKTSLQAFLVEYDNGRVTALTTQTFNDSIVLSLNYNANRTYKAFLFNKTSLEPIIK